MKRYLTEGDVLNVLEQVNVELPTERLLAVDVADQHIRESN